MQDKLGFGFLRTKKTLTERIKDAFTGTIGDDLWEELVECLVMSDIAYLTAEKLIETAKSNMRRGEKGDSEAVRAAVKQSALELLAKKDSFNGIQTPAIILVSGVNGVGKTTSIAKLANLYKSEGKSVLLAAADTFRAAASEQLNVWANRLNVPIVRSAEGQDASSVIYDAIDSAKSKGTDVVLCDTAGRLQNKKNLMSELEKFYRVIEKNKGGYQVYTLIVLDAMIGQNSISQLENFAQVMRPDGIILTKTDGSAKGGVILAIADKSDVPVWYVGTGEGLEDIAAFDAQRYVDAIL